MHQQNLEITMFENHLWEVEHHLNPTLHSRVTISSGRKARRQSFAHHEKIRRKQFSGGHVLEGKRYVLYRYTNEIPPRPILYER